MQITVQGKDRTAQFECEPGERILHAGLRAGLDLPYECASGTCGTCKARVTEGATDYHWHEAPGRKFVKAEKNEILMCQCHPLTDCSLVVARAIEHARAGAGKPLRTHGTIRNFRLLTHDVCAFEVSLDEPMSFEAGQFVLLSVDAIRGARSYSMTNYEDETRTLHFLVKRLATGKLTDWLFTGTPEGARVEIFGPLGRATFQPELARPILCIAGGSGVAGFRSILTLAGRTGYFARFKGDVFFGVRTERDAFWLDELAEFVRNSSGGLNVTVALSHEEPSPELVARYPEISFATGFIHEVAGKAMQGKYENVMAYVAGPPPMVDAALRMLLLEARLPGTSIRYDKFS